MEKLTRFKTPTIIIFLVFEYGKNDEGKWERKEELRHERNLTHNNSALGSYVSILHHMHSISSVSHVSQFPLCLDRIWNDRSEAIFAKRVRAHPVVPVLRFNNMRCDAVESTIEWQHVSKDDSKESSESKNVHALHFFEFDVLSSELFENLMSLIFYDAVFMNKKGLAPSKYRWRLNSKNAVTT